MVVLDVEIYYEAVQRGFFQLPSCCVAHLSREMGGRPPVVVGSSRRQMPRYAHNAPVPAQVSYTAVRPALALTKSRVAATQPRKRPKLSAENGEAGMLKLESKKGRVPGKKLSF